jgi:predicted amidohydrolase
VAAGDVAAGSVAAGSVAAGAVAAGSMAAGNVAAGSTVAGSVAAKRGTQVRVALAQIDPVLGDLERNLVLHEQMLAEARRHQADLVVFPELSLTGYYLRDLVADVARPAECHELQRLAAAAGTMAVVVGFVEHDAHGDLFNSAAFLEDGAVRHVHRKVYLPTYGLFDEQRYFAAGHRVRAFDSRRLGRIGVVVCEDFWHLSVATILQAERVDWLLCLANSPARGVREAEVRTASTYRHIGQTYAQLLGAHVAVCNRAGVEEGLCFWGGSFLVAPDGEIAAAAPPLDAHLLVVDVDANAPRRARLQTPLGRDERLSVTLGELGRIQRRQYESD